MRPTRLDLEGFASFREPTTLDFTDADLFVLSGPTGSGKSSVIDALTFALYGVVARYGDKRLVAPVIANGRNEARVRLQFAVGGHHYTAVRVVRRTRGGGASTKEARLERWRGDDPEDAAVVAATADELTEAVEAVLGLGYEHFTTTVVLPQGAFQRFLHARPSERQGLLVELLDLAVFGRIGQAARTRAATATATADVLAQQLDATADRVTDEAVDAARRRVTGLAEAVAVVDEATPELEEIVADGRERARRVEELGAQRDALAAVTPPEDLAELATRMAGATTDRERAAQAQQAARARRRELDATVDDLPSADAVGAQRGRRARLDDLAGQARSSATAAREATTAEREATTVVASAETALAAARSDLEAAQRADLVATLAGGLQAGDPCPICERPLAGAVDVRDEPVAHARDAVRAAERTLADQRARATAAGTRATRLRERLEQVEDQRTRLRGELDDAELPTADDELATLAARIDTASAARREARAAEAEADDALAGAERAVTTARAGLEEARSALDGARDRVAALEPPSLPRDDVGAAWATLLAWAERERPAADERVAAAEQARTAARQAYAARMADLLDRVGAHDVDTTGLNQVGPLRSALADALATARSRHDRLVDQRDEHRRKREDLATARSRAAVATELGRLLNRQNFEKWLLARAVNRLVVGASHHLQELTRGAYTLRLEPDGSFGIVDHANGGEVRSARTLSGGETFLASLSLALALSDHVADFAADGAARLESLFIDEGFGTLDAATVDVVRTALEELGSTGRMVGVVTHVQALAEQLPVQFHVRKESQSSVVERVDV